LIVPLHSTFPFFRTLNASASLCYLAYEGILFLKQLSSFNCPAVSFVFCLSAQKRYMIEYFVIFSAERHMHCCNISEYCLHILSSLLTKKSNATLIQLARSSLLPQRWHAVHECVFFLLDKWEVNIGISANMFTLFLTITSHFPLSHVSASPVTGQRCIIFTFYIPIFPVRTLNVFNGEIESGVFAEVFGTITRCIIQLNPVENGGEHIRCKVMRLRISLYVFNYSGHVW